MGVDNKTRIIQLSKYAFVFVGLCDLHMTPEVGGRQQSGGLPLSLVVLPKKLGHNTLKTIG